MLLTLTTVSEHLEFLISNDTHFKDVIDDVCRDRKIENKTKLDGKPLILISEHFEFFSNDTPI